MIDHIDRKIVIALQDRGRRSNADVAREVGVTEATVRRRIDRLLSEGVITIAVIPDEPKLGMNHHVLLGFRCNLVEIDPLVQRVGQMPNLRWVGRTVGPYDLMAEAYFPDAEVFHAFYLKELTKVPGINTVDVITVLEQPKKAYNWDFMMAQAPKQDPEAP